VFVPGRCLWVRPGAYSTGQHLKGAPLWEPIALLTKIALDWKKTRSIIISVMKT